jgi:hypothetical protein
MQRLQPWDVHESPYDSSRPVAEFQILRRCGASNVGALFAVPL